MGKEIMCASIITAIILCIVGIIKVLPPCLSFKEKHPKWYKGIFYSMSLILAAVFPILSELYILNGSLASVNFIVLIFTTIAGVFGLYTSYEGLGLKELVKKLVSKVSKLLNTYSDSKLAKVVGKVGIEKLTEIDAKLKAEAEAKKIEEEKKLAETQVAETVVIEQPAVDTTASQINTTVVEGQLNTAQQATPVNSVQPTNVQ